MTDSLNIGKTWTVTVPAGSGRTIGQNMWQYSVFPMSTAPSIMYPSDKLSSMNDAQLMNFDFGTTQFLDSSTNIMYQVMPMMKQWMAQQAELYQKIMENLHSSSKVTVENSDNKDNVDGTKVIKESQINSVLNKIAADPANKDRFNGEITITNKDGKEEKTTLLRRLIQLSKEYQEAPDTAEISEENYKLLWDIAGKYAKTGELSTDDYKTLLEIAKNPGGPGAYKKPEEKPKTKATPMTDIANYKKTDVEYKNQVTNIAADYKNALFGWGTKYAPLQSATDSITADNIIEVYDEFNRKYGVNEGETLIESIYNDFDDWTNSWYGIKGSASTFTAIHDKLAERAQNHIEKYGDKDDSLKKALASFNAQFESINDDNYDSKKDSIKKMFADMINAIKTAEAATIAEEKAQKEE